jgi:uncharacterized protein (TIGR02687 family)
VKRILDSLSRVFDHHRLVFWYDAADEWSETFQTFDDDDTVKVRVSNNEFATKVRIVRAPADTRFLVYVPTARPADADNWLLDLLLQGHEYRADRASLTLQDLGLPQEFREIVEQHAAFFNSGKRVQGLKELIGHDDQPGDIRVKMMAVLAGVAADIDALLLHFLDEGASIDGPDPVLRALASSKLIEPFWREVKRAFGYSSSEPGLRDFAVTLFRGANPLDAQVALHPHGRIFLQRWKDSQAHSDAFEAWSRHMEQELQIANLLMSVDQRQSIGDADAFELFERFCVHRICQLFQKGASADELRLLIQQRRTSFWHAQHADAYRALEHALELRDLLGSLELMVESVDVGIRRYMNGWWRLDMEYRRCIYHLRRYGQVQLMEAIREWVEGKYVNDFLQPVLDRWSDRVRDLHRWECAELPSQRRFFENYVQPFLSKGQKVFVIVSDGMRYEAVAEFAQRLRSSNRWSADLEAIFGALPSYTQLGMASLLPGREWVVDARTSNVTVDGRSASGTAARSDIIAQACAGRGIAVSAEHFLELNTKTDGRALMRDNDVIYIFHNHVDKVGDSAATEAKTLDAVEQAFDELDHIIRKVANINGSNMLLTADHGFIFQQEAVDDADMTPLPSADEWTWRNRRFALGRDIQPTQAVKVFSSDALGVGGDWAAAFPLSLARFPQPGSGKRYVHGGVSPQEVIVPVLRIHKARSDDTARVEVELLHVPAKITTGQLSIALFQQQPVADKVLPRTLRVGVYSSEGTLLSESRTHTFDSKEEEARLRETMMVLTLTSAADAYNNREVELRLQDTVPGTSQIVTYRAHAIRLQKPFTSDFDDI